MLKKTFLKKNSKEHKNFLNFSKNKVKKYLTTCSNMDIEKKY